MRSMLPGAPWLLAHKSMLSPEKPLKISLQGNDYVMWLNEKGEIQSLPNACPHMGAMLSAGWCSNGQVVCPFHALAFNGQGCTVLPGSNKTTLPMLKPLELIVQGDFIWSYGHHAPLLPIPPILDEIATDFEFMGVAGECSVNTDLLSMLLIMHDYDHQNGTHRPLFEITEVQFREFIDEGHYSAAFYDMPRTQPQISEMLKNPALLLMEKILKAHLENYFPFLVLFNGTTPLGQIRQCHIFVPESATHTRTYVLVYAKPKNWTAKMMLPLFKSSALQLVNTVVEQDADILHKIYADTPQKIKLNNEVGMDWVRRNYDNFPESSTPNLSSKVS